MVIADAGELVDHCVGAFAENEKQEAIDLMEKPRGCGGEVSLFVDSCL